MRRASDGCPRGGAAVSQPVVIAEDLGVARHPGVAGFPVALPREAGVRSIDGLVVRRADGKGGAPGAEVPAQLEVLSRWGDAPDACAAPIRWAYAFVLAEVAPRGRTHLVVEHRPAAELPDPPPSPALSIAEDRRKIEIHTGAARFVIAKDRPSGIVRAELFDAAGAATPVLEASQDGLLVDIGGPIEGEVESAVVERAGPVVADVAIRAVFEGKKASAPIRTTLRLRFTAGSAAVGIDATYSHGAIGSSGADGASNRIAIDRVALRLPLALGSAAGGGAGGLGGRGAGPVSVLARGAEKVHRISQRTGRVSIEQKKRSPEKSDVLFTISDGSRELERGGYADRPLLAASGERAFAVATIGMMGPRDPQALRFDLAAGVLELDFQSEPLHVGGARRIWSRAAIDFGLAKSADPELRGTQAWAQASRPLIGAPSVEHLAKSRVLPPLPSSDARDARDKTARDAIARFDKVAARLHETTAEYLRKYRITGTQIWPDLPRSSCTADGRCEAAEKIYFEGGDNNYWDWSRVELERFLRTADPAFLHDFALPEAITIAETISFRPGPDEEGRSVFAGFSPCYGGGSGQAGRWLEGANNRRDNCPGDYSYNKVHQLAYVLTADRRFVELFEQAAETVARRFEPPFSRGASRWYEPVPARLNTQLFEQLLNGAEFARSDKGDRARRYRDRARALFDFMRENALERGHVCNLLGTGVADPKSKGECTSEQAWMLPPFIEWVFRLSTFADHRPAAGWLREWAKTSLRFHASRDDRGRPDIGKEAEGWRTAYRCRASERGVDDKSCVQVTDIENGGRFYATGLLAYLNAIGIVLGSDPSDPLGLCEWLPGALDAALEKMSPLDNNHMVWGKAPGLAYAFVQPALGAIERCDRQHAAR